MSEPLHPVTDPDVPARCQVARKGPGQLVARDPRAGADAARRAGVPFFHRQAVLHPVGLDDAQPAGRRPAGGQQVSLSAGAGFRRAFHVLPRSNWRDRAATPEYGDIVIVVPPDRTEDLIKRVIGLPGRPDRGGRRTHHPQRQGDPARGRAAGAICPPTRRSARAGRALTTCSDASAPRLPNGQVVYEPPTFRETLPNGATYLIIDHSSENPLDNYARDHRARQATCS